MAFSCISHIFINLTTPTQPVHKPNHTGLIHQASLPTNPPSTFPPAPNQPTTAFAPNLVSGATFRERMQEILSEPRATERIETQDEDRGEDGTSWVLANKDVDGWDVGREKATQMFVKRKGRGEFRFEDAMVEGWGIGLREKEASYRVMEECNKDNEKEVLDRQEMLRDGFKYRGWVDEEIQRN
ncbi:hypothetical protein CC77DRAFT_1064049 [Alternaria alternata]|uniref:Uncharacterized protein n=1 Tax=Alternaria alternata TaxID=5599 RepID=A0A177DE32_ALTAL|nr:hypothetical protein CC77DRAFT_1064049 [Alternaria alternata]OAG17422.1 hypothetical protein CC77DRAFT_1064049 [Alternaria alternata]RYN58623.1 hypothetical protein AA0118_g7123 [Alternaria tenuissima]